MSKIFLIPGLGADTRAYNNIDLHGYDVIPIAWVEPIPDDTLVSYAQKLVSLYDIKPDSILIGNSLGGMIAVEIAKIIPIKKVILISSIKTIDEAPAYFSFFRNIPLYQLIPKNSIAAMGVLIKPMFGHMSSEDVWLFRDMLKNTSPVFAKWAMGAALHWDNRIIPQNLYHITGDKDRVFPYQKIKDASIVKGGTHIMIFDKAKEINNILKHILK